MTRPERTCWGNMLSVSRHLLHSIIGEDVPHVNMIGEDGSHINMIREDGSHVNMIGKDVPHVDMMIKFKLFSIQ